MNTEVTIDKRLVEIKPGSFIFEFPNALSTEICKDIIERFENSEDEHYQGRVGKDFNEDQSIKISTDMVISGKEHWKDVDETLFTSLAKALSSVKRNMIFLKVHLKMSAMLFRGLILENFSIGTLMQIIQVLAIDSLLQSGT